MTDASSESFEGCAILEIMGHRRVAGFVRAVTLFGAPMCRIDVPYHDKEGTQLTQFYGGASVFCLTPTTEEQAKELAPRPWPSPVAAQLPGGQADADGEEDDVEEQPW